MIELSCFVACAFGKEDVDLIFDRVIGPVLAELGMRVNRVDRIEHNDDIDDKIIELIHTWGFLPKPSKSPVGIYNSGYYEHSCVNVC